MFQAEGTECAEAQRQLDASPLGVKSPVWLSFREWQGWGNYRINQSRAFLLWAELNFLNVQNPAWTELLDPLAAA